METGHLRFIGACAAVVAALSLNTIPAQADSQVFRYAENGHLYQRIDTRMSWHQAKEQCEYWSGHLATIGSAGENEFIFDNFVAPGAIPWIGGSDENSEGNWYWVTGEPWDYTNWWPGQPSNYCGIDGCDNYLAIADHRVNLWDDVPDVWRAFICEWDTALPERTLHFAQFGTGGTLRFDLVLVNPSRDLSASGQVQFWEPDGDPLDPSLFLPGAGDFELPPQGSKTFSTTGTGNVVTGSATVTADLPLDGVVRFFLPSAGLAGVGSSEPESAVMVPVRRQGRLSTGVAIRNTHSSGITLDLTLQDEEGQVVPSGTAELNIPANGRVSEFVETYFPDADTSNFRGTLLIEVRSGKMAAMGLELESGGSDPKFTTLPVTAVAHEEYACNLTLRRPAEWSDRVVISKTEGTHTDSTELTTQDTLYVDHAILNIGKTATGAAFDADLLVDDVLVNRFSHDSSLASDGWAQWQDYSIGSLSAGTHKITVKVDPQNDLPECNEADNDYSRYIVVKAATDDSFNGSWAGMTSQDRPLAFDVENGRVTKVTMDIRVQGTFCTVTFSGGIKKIPGSLIEDGSFSWSVTDPSWNTLTLTGTFASSTAASGTFTATSQNCNGTAQVTWTATKSP